LFELAKIKKDNTVLYIRSYRSIHVVYSYTTCPLYLEIS